MHRKILQMHAMPKVQKNKFYAVKIGRGGPNIYQTWDECKENTARWPGAVHKSFRTRPEAEAWLSIPVPCLLPAYVPGIPTAVTESFLLPKTSAPSEPLGDFVALEPDETTSLSMRDPKPVISLSVEQRSVLERVKRQENVFFTGSAGTGKSVLLREIISALGGRASDTLAITASTGIAAVNIGGTTVHSWAGIGLGQDSAKNLAGKFLGQKSFAAVLDRWRSVESLIIDEVSMIDGGLFDKLEYIARILRRSEKPFGGIQLILSGDFCQLPPVPNGRNTASTFAFEAETWNECVGPPVTLSRVFRQKDQAFVDMLNAMRFGKVSPAVAETFKNLSRRVKYDDGIDPTELFPTRAEVQNANDSRLRALPGLFTTYESQDTPGTNSNGVRISVDAMDRLLERLVAMKILSLKVGAQVMLIKNTVQGSLVNGSVGQVVAFQTQKEALEAHPTLTRLDDKGRHGLSSTDTRKWPVVRFTNGKTLLCVPAEFTVNNSTGEMEARRLQIPLIPAWALSVHKSQGQTLERVKVDLRRTFEKGQAYVALSRATCMEHLQVLNFNAAKVEAHPRVLAWFKTINPGLFHGPLADDNDYFEAFEDSMDMDDAIASYYT